MNLSKIISGMFLVALLFIAAMTPAFAQNAQIGGRVTDPSGAVIPGVTITLISTETGVARKATSNEEGYYAIPQLQPGKYRLTAQKDWVQAKESCMTALSFGWVIA